MTTTGTLTVGSWGQAVLDVTAGATLTTGDANLATQDGSIADVTVSGSGSQWEIGGSLTVGSGGDATLTVTDLGAVLHPNPDPLDVGPYGQVIISGGGTLDRNGGSVDIGTAVGGTASVLVTGAGSLLTGNGGLTIGVSGPGTLTVEDSGLVADEPNPEPIIVGGLGTVLGDGLLVGDMLNGGLFEPGLSAGVLTVNGDYTQSPTGTLEVEVTGPGPGQFDVLAVSGTVTLAGTLALQTSFVPAEADSFEVLTYSSKVGEFEGITGLDLGGVTTFETVYGATCLTLVATETTGLTIDPDPVWLGVTETVKLTATAQLANGGTTNASASASWSSDDDVVATVDGDGTVTGVSQGTTTIRALFQGFEATATINVTSQSIPAVSECPPPDDRRKNRFITFLANNPGLEVSIQAELVGVGPGECYDNDPSGDIGMTWWVTPPVCTDRNGLDVTAEDPGCTGNLDGIPNIWRSQLTTNIQDPMIWPEACIYLADCEVIPIADYYLRATLDPHGGPLLFSEPTRFETIRRPATKCWADCVGAWDGSQWSPPNGVVNMDDVMAAVFCFKQVENRPRRTWMEVDDEGVNMVVNFADIQMIVQGFKGQPYPFSDPAECP